MLLTSALLYSAMNELSENRQHCQRLLDRLISALQLEFIPAADATEDGWYIWRNNADWNPEDYTVLEFSAGEFNEPEPADSYGAIWEMNWIKAYGELAGPILGR